MDDRVGMFLRGHAPQLAALVVTAAWAIAPGVVASARAEAARVYEQVTPADKDFSVLEPSPARTDAAVVSSRSGDAVGYNTFGPLPGAASGGVNNFFIGARGSSDWTTEPALPPLEPVAGGAVYPRLLALSADLSKAVILSGNPPLVPEAPLDVGSLYLRDMLAGTYELLTTVPGSQGGTQFLRFGGASSAWDHVVFMGIDPLFPGAPPYGASSSYEWVNGELRNVGILPDGTPASQGVLIGRDASSEYRAQHAISEDGRRIFFTSGQRLYLREDGQTTTDVSASQRSLPDPAGPQPRAFWAASADGARVFFTSPEALTNDAKTGTDGSGNPTDAGNDLYRYDSATHDLADLTVDDNPADAATGAAVQGVVGVSDDGTYVYFVALGALAPSATPGAPNLYVWHSGETRLIGTLDAADGQVWTATVSGLAGLTSRVASDGRHVVFSSVASLTGYDNTNSSGMPVPEVFRYSADTHLLECVSCSPTARPDAGSMVRPPASGMLFNPPRNLTDDGARVFFDTTDALVPADTNHRRDVYGFQDGTLRLISTGNSGADAMFRDASASGDDVFLSTRGRLVPSDVDDHVDLYDARLGGGFPASPAGDPCDRSECAIPPTTPLSATVTPGSERYVGPGNVRIRRSGFIVRPVSAFAWRQLARTGRLRLRVRVSGAGVASATMRGNVRGRALATIGRAQKAARGAGIVSLHLTMSPRARRALKQRRRMRVLITVSYSEVTASRRMTFTLHR